MANGSSSPSDFESFNNAQRLRNILLACAPWPPLGDLTGALTTLDLKCLDDTFAVMSVAEGQTKNSHKLNILVIDSMNSMV